MGETEELQAEHRQIETMARALVALVSGAERPDPLAFLRFRREFGRILGRHLKREDWTVYPALLAHRDPRVRMLAQTLRAETDSFSALFTAYAERWTTARIADEWEAFRAETLAMVAGLLDRIAVEDARLYPILATGSAPMALPTRKFG